MTQDTNRLLMEIEHQMRSVNREILNPVVQELEVGDMKAVTCLVANARARYLKTFLALGEQVNDGQLSDDQLNELSTRRREYDELVNAAKALETAIQRGYLDVRSSR